MKKTLLFLLMLMMGFCSLLVSAQTPPCNPIPVTDATPWLVDFSTAPTCWTFPTDNVNSSWMWDDVDQDIYHDYGIYESDAFSPILDISNVTTPYLKFSQKRTDFSFSTVSDELYVYFRSTEVGEDSIWYLLAAYTDVCNDWFIDSIPLPQNMNTIQFKFHAVGKGDLANGVNIDFVTVYNEEDAPICIAPIALNAFNIGEYSVELSWALASDGNVNLYYSVISDSLYNLIETPMLEDGVFLLDNLETATQYKWYLELDCGNESVQTPLYYFSTGCGLLSTPRYEGFEYVNIGHNPACWNIINGIIEGNNTFPGVNNINGPQYTHSGNHSYRFKYNSTGQYAVLPEFDNVFSTLQVNFWARREHSNSGTFSVGYVTDSLSASNFVSLMSLTGAQLNDNSFHNYTVRFDSVATVDNSHYYIAFKYESTEHWDWFIDDISITEITPCATPDSLNAGNATGTSIDLSWTGNTYDYTLYYKETGEANYTELANVTLDANGVYTLDGLTPSTDYDWYVAANCDDGSTIVSFVTGHFTTVCGALTTFPVSWDMENNLTAGTSDYPLPSCWNRISSDASFLNPYVYHQSSNAHSGSNFFRFYNRYPDSYAILPAIDNTALSFANLQISFYAKITQVNAALSLEVGVMTDPEDASTFTTIGTIIPTESYALYEIPFLGYTGSGHYIAIRNVSNLSGNSWTSFYVDDISLSSSSSCTTPTNLTAVSSTHSATLSWVSSATTFTLYYKEATDNSWQNISNVSLNSNNEYVLTGLLDGTAYDWFVETSCGITPELTSSQAYFSTIMEPVDLPYQTDFTNSEDWLMNNGHATNYWMTGIPYGESQAALFITRDGSYAEYNSSVNAVVTAEKAFQMPESNLVHVEFDVLAGGEGGVNPADYLKVFLAPNTEVFNVGTTSSNAQSAAAYSTHAFNFSDYIWQTEEHYYPYKLNLTQDSTLHISMNVSNPDINGEAKIVFLWRNDNYLSTQTTSVIIRNFVITADTAYTPPIEDGINNITLANSISLMPNPADNYIDLHINSNVKVKEAVVYNAFGQMIQTVELNNNEARIDISGMASGMYFVRVNGDNVSATKKFIKR